MKKINKLFSVFYLFFFAAVSLADKQTSLALFYDEVEQGAGSQTMRYIINKQFLRIDNGDDKADFILFDVNKSNIYSVNHDDQTILKIENNAWAQPEFDFQITTNLAAANDAPKIQGKTVYTYQVNVNKKTCTKVFLIKDTYIDEMKILYQYQQILSGQQVKTLKNTPEELHTPCFLIDQVYHSGDYFKIGLPIQISYSREYVKFLKNYKKVKFDATLFKLPASYKEFNAFTN